VEEVGLALGKVEFQLLCFAKVVQAAKYVKLSHQIQLEGQVSKYFNFF